MRNEIRRGGYSEQVTEVGQEAMGIEVGGRWEEARQVTIATSCNGCWQCVARAMSLRVSAVEDIALAVNISQSRDCADSIRGKFLEMRTDWM